ncbi:MAG: nuclear transport factor 2 family protein [Hyphomicrobiales bacterium]
MTTVNPTIAGLRRAVETRDAKTLKSFYSGDATMTIIDSDNPPNKPRTLKGAKEIGAFLDDVCSRDMTHTLNDGVIDGGHLAYVEACRYPDGTRVVASNTAELGTHGIKRQTVVQAWDS